MINKEEFCHKKCGKTKNDVDLSLCDNCKEFENQAKPKYQLLDTETVMDDSDHVFFGYVYIADMKFITCEIFTDEDITVADLKRWGKYKEIRRCDLFSHGHEARIGDELVIGEIK